MRALLLGGEAFIRHRLTRSLVHSGHDVTMLGAGARGTDADVHALGIDRANAEAVAEALRASDWDTIFDTEGFADASGVQSQIDQMEGRVGHLIYLTSTLAYDAANIGYFPWTEDMASDTAGPETVGGAMALAERALLDQHNRTDFPVTILRMCSVYGPENDHLDMESATFARLREGRPIIVPHGGLVASSYGHVDDLCDAMMRVIGKRQALGEVVNVSADGVSAARYVTTLAEIVGVEPEIIHVPDALLATVPAGAFPACFEARHHALVSTEKLERLVGWPRYDLRSGHEHTYEWFAQQDWSGRLSARFTAEADWAARYRSAGS